jgi:hypothetical protein
MANRRMRLTAALVFLVLLALALVNGYAQIDSLFFDW